MSEATDISSVTNAWRERLGMVEMSGESTLENAQSEAPAFPAIEDRIFAAGDAMQRVVKDRFRADPDLLDAVQRIVTSSREGVSELASQSPAPSDMQLSAFEAVIAFDGTRPSFLVRDHRIDFESSFSTSAWKTTLSPRLESLAKVASCVGCVEIAGSAIGTAFLASPTLALTNRHVAQAIAKFGETAISLRGESFIDFGREDRGRTTFDRRKVLQVLFAGPSPISNTVDHDKFDVALLELSPSTLAGELAERALPFDCKSELAENVAVAVIGFPGDWSRWVPPSTRNANADALAKLLQGMSGAKRLAPGASGLPAAAPGARTVIHDATTINGNSGSPLLPLRGLGTLPAIGLHYGGRWNGERANWAHLLKLCRDAPITTGTSFIEALQTVGIAS